MITMDLDPKTGQSAKWKDRDDSMSRIITMCVVCLKFLSGASEATRWWEALVFFKSTRTCRHHYLTGNLLLLHLSSIHFHIRFDQQNGCSRKCITGTQCEVGFWLAHALNFRTLNESTHRLSLPSRFWATGDTATNESIPNQQQSHLDFITNLVSYLWVVEDLVISSKMMHTPPRECNVKEPPQNIDRMIQWKNTSIPTTIWVGAPGHRSFNVYHNVSCYSPPWLYCKK